MGKSLVGVEFLDGAGDVALGLFDVVGGEPVEVVEFLGFDGAGDFAGETHNDHAVGDDQAGGDDGTSGDEAFGADVSAAEEGGGHADEGAAADE